MSQRTDVKIFIASSGELKVERLETISVLTEINKNFAHLHLEPILFELDTSSGNNPGKDRIQDEINDLLDAAQIVVVLFYSQVGAFTKEEFDRALAADKKVFLYLKDGFMSDDSEKIKKYLELLNLKNEVEKASKVRYQKFDNVANFNGLLYKDLSKYLKDLHPIQISVDENSVEDNYNFESNNGSNAIDNPVAFVDAERTTDDITAAINLLIDKAKDLNYNSSEEDIRNARDLRTKIFSEFAFAYEQIDNIPQLIQHSTSDLFKSIYTEETLSRSLREEISNIRQSDKYNWYNRSVIVSALTLSLLNFKKVDQYKILLLCDFISDMEDKVWQKGITGLVLALTFRKNAWLKYEMVIKKLEAFRDRLEIQNSLQVIAFIFDHRLYDIYEVDNKIYELDFFKNNPANCFVPFYPDNPSMDYFIENSNSDNPIEAIEFISKSPIPDILKYYWCYSDANIKQSKSKKTPKYFNYLVRASVFFEPYLQYLNELHAFIHHYPQTTKEEIFSKELSLASVKLKDYILKEKGRHLIQGMHYFKNDDYHNAVNHLRQALKYSSNDLTVLKNLANSLKMLDKDEEELSIRYQIEKIDEKDSVNDFDIAQTLLKRRNHDLSLEYVEKALKIDKSNTAILLLKAKIFDDLRMYPSALAICKEVLSREPDNYEACCTIGSIYKDLYDFSNAQKQYYRAKKLEIDGAKANIGLVDLAVYTTVNNEQLIQELSELIKKFPKDINAYLPQLNYYNQIEDYVSAISFLNQILSKFPTKHILLNYRANLYALCEKYEKALADYYQYIQLVPNDYNAYIRRSNVFQIIKEDKKANQDLQMALQVLNAVNNLDFLGRARILIKQKEIDAAFTEFDNALSKTPEDAEIYIHRAELHLAQEAFDKAIDDLKTAILLTPFDPNAHAAIAEIYSLIDEQTLAVEHFSKAIEIFPSVPTFYNARANFYKKHLNYELSLADFQKAAQISKRNTDHLVSVANIQNLMDKPREAFETIQSIETNNLLVIDQAFYYGTIAEIHSKLGNDDDFFINLERGASNKLLCKGMEDSIIEKYKTHPKFVELMENYPEFYSNSSSSN